MTKPRRAPLLAFVPPPVFYAATFVVGWAAGSMDAPGPVWIEARPRTGLGWFS